jgi:Cobalamin biosynthesis protein CobT (nicotinate-mononucleotide:5, 6-dimethylbenzimidazole phosphoribosyltransferase)
LFKLDNKKIPIKFKKIKKEWDKNFKKDLNVLKANLKNQDTFNQTVAKIITNIDIKEEKDDKDEMSNKERFEDIDKSEKQEKKEGKPDKNNKEQNITIAADLPETENLSEKNSEEEKFEEVEDESGISNKKFRKIFSKNEKKYKVFTNEFDEFSKAEDLENEEELLRLRSTLDHNFYIKKFRF